MRFFLVIVLFMLPFVLFAENSRQTLIRGQSTTLHFDYEIGEVAIADQNISDYIVTESRHDLYLNPKKEGKTVLTLWDFEGAKRDELSINVVSVGINELLEDAKSTFSGSGNLDFVSEGKKIVIRGTVFNPMELSRLHSFANQFKDIELEVKLSGTALGFISKEIEEAIATPGLRVKYIKNRLALEGTAYSIESAQRAEKIAKLYDENLINLVTVKDTKRNPAKEKIVSLDVNFIEIKKTALKTFGINWSPGSIPQQNGNPSGIAGSAGGIASQLIGFVFNLAPKIKFARQRGDARVLENPSFIVKSGESANFFSGTQIPYYSQQSVVFKDVGIKIDAEPIASDEDVDLKININITSPSAGGVTKGIDTSTISTTAYCKAGSSFALAGIFRGQDAKMKNRIPDDINTSSSIFSLFLSKDYVSNQSEFVIFVTPKVIENISNVVSPAGLKMTEWNEIKDDIKSERSKKKNKQRSFKLPESMKGK